MEQSFLRSQLSLIQIYSRNSLPLTESEDLFSRPNSPPIVPTTSKLRSAHTVIPYLGSNLIPFIVCQLIRL
jgi:hypothetical protein